jgi:hypothetical protein
MKITIVKGGGPTVPPLPTSDSIVKAAPAIGLAFALVLLVAVPMPAANADIVKLIAAGFLGALTQGRMTGGSQ